MGKDNEKNYILKRLLTAKAQSVLFYLFRIFRIKKRKIVFTTIEGTTGFSCNPKYIALELIKQNRDVSETKQYEFVWLVNDTSKKFPPEIRKIKNSLWNRAYHLTTASIWIDNSRKQLEVRKRPGQIYIQTWHAKLGFKPTCLDRGTSFSRIAYLVSKHDSDMVDYWLSNSDWYDKTLKTGSLYEGKTLRTGSPRCDILLNDINTSKIRVRMHYGLPENSKIIMLCPTFRGGSQAINRKLTNESHLPDISSLIKKMEQRFCGEWYVFLRLHPQLTVRGISESVNVEETFKERVIDVSREDDMYEVLAGCDAFLTDYSSAAFDAALMKIPIFLYCDDFSDYEGERGSLLWDLRKLPFPFAENEDVLWKAIGDFDETEYQNGINSLLNEANVEEDGHASEKVVSEINNIMS